MNLKNRVKVKSKVFDFDNRISIFLNSKQSSIDLKTGLKNQNIHVLIQINLSFYQSIQFVPKSKKGKILFLAQTCFLSKRLPRYF